MSVLVIWICSWILAGFSCSSSFTTPEGLAARSSSIKPSLSGIIEPRVFDGFSSKAWGSSLLASTSTLATTTEPIISLSKGSGFTAAAVTMGALVV